MMYKLYCGGNFCFDCRECGYESEVAKDYRAVLLGTAEALLRPNRFGNVMVKENVAYIGPFYFETEDMQSEDIILREKGMIELCTDAIFLLDSAACPGTIAEVMYANFLQKRIHIFYVRHNDDEETECDLHTPCWFPIQFCQLTNNSVTLNSCTSVADAVNEIQTFVSTL